MKVLTNRSGIVLHAAKDCPGLAQGRIYELDETQAPARASRCRHPRCHRVFARRAAA